MPTFTDLRDASRVLRSTNPGPETLGAWAEQTLGHAIQMGLELEAHIRPGKLETDHRVFGIEVDGVEMVVDLSSVDGWPSVQQVWIRGAPVFDLLDMDCLDRILDKAEDALADEAEAAAACDAETDRLFKAV